MWPAQVADERHQQTARVRNSFIVRMSEKT
jgi:hypothetical protein